jgi:hypothetical protein
MGTFLLSIAIVALSITGLAAGVLLGREPLRGSCGGVACDKGGTCDACRGLAEEKTAR